ncbi:MAG: hypothetical protein D6743_05755 [Calditrichaeota bacterium]|nr:MAG: hypothetical protein D6743_05755 [Calditrichota bacterium]
MSAELDKLHRDLAEIYALTKSVSRDLEKGDLDAVFRRLDVRGKKIQILRQSMASFGKGTDNKSRDKGRKEKIAALIQHIKELDEVNMAFIKDQLKTISESIQEVSRDLDAFKQFRTVAKKSRRQLIDFMY